MCHARWRNTDTRLGSCGEYRLPGEHARREIAHDYGLWHRSLVSDRHTGSISTTAPAKTSGRVHARRPAGVAGAEAKRPARIVTASPRNSSATHPPIATAVARVSLLNLKCLVRRRAVSVTNAPDSM